MFAARLPTMRLLLLLLLLVVVAAVGIVGAAMEADFEGESLPVVRDVAELRERVRSGCVAGIPLAAAIAGQLAAVRDALATTAAVELVLLDESMLDGDPVIRRRDTLRTTLHRHADRDSTTITAS
jgi:hypothetical protein